MAASSRSKTTGRSRKTTRVAVTPKSWIIVARGMSISSVRTKRPAGVDDVVAEERRSEDVAAEEDELAGDRIDLRVGGHRRGQPAVEVVDPGPSRSGERAWGNPDSTRARVRAGVADDMGVGRPVDRLARAPRWRGPHLGGQRPGPDPAVAVAGGPAAGQGDGVDHPVAAEPVVVGLVGRHHRRVGTVAQQPTVEVGGDARRSPAARGRRCAPRAPARSFRGDTGWPSGSSPWCRAVDARRHTGCARRRALARW